MQYYGPRKAYIVAGRPVYRLCRQPTDCSRTRIAGDPGHCGARVPDPGAGGKDVYTYPTFAPGRAQTVPECLCEAGRVGDDAGLGRVDTQLTQDTSPPTARPLHIDPLDP